MTTVEVVLSPAEQAELAHHETTIARGMQTFVEVGEALAAIRNSKLYRTEFSTFEEYCDQRWGFNDSRARQLISAAETVTTVTVLGLPAPENERQVRELGRVPELQRADVWRETLAQTNGKPTAKAIRRTANAASPRAAADVPAPAGTSPARHRRPLTEAFRDASWDVVKVAERLERLADDDRFPRNAEQVGRMCRADLLRAADLLATVIERFQSTDKESTE